MIETYSTTQVPAITLPSVCTVMLDGSVTLVTVHNAKWSKQVWLMPMDGYRPLRRLDPFEPVTLATLEGVI